MDKNELFSKLNINAEGSNGEKARPPKRPTQVDDWRPEGGKPAARPRKSTQVDDWNPGKRPKNPTQVDDDWSSTFGAVEKTPVGQANAYAKLEDFQNAAGQLRALTTSRGRTFSVENTLSRDGGESAVLLCRSPEGEAVAAKIYWDSIRDASIEARKQVLKYMETEAGKRYALPVLEIGTVEMGGCPYYFEIMPYCPQGDLSGDAPKSFEEIVELTRYLNEMLKSIHDFGILHRDIKPANLYHYDGRIVLGDFGVAKLVNAGATSRTVGSDGYRAPETLLVVNRNDAAFFFTKAIDYYSLGVTLGSLYEGKFVYENMSGEMLVALMHESRVPLTKDDPKRPLLQNLLNGMCQYDAKHRFCYKEVALWLQDHHYAPGGSAAEDGQWPKAYRILGKECRDERSLFEAITQNATYWNEARDMLYGNYFQDFFRSFRTDLARAAQRADEQWRTKDRDMGLAVFLKALYAPGAIVWKGYTFRSISELADKMQTTSTPTAYAQMLQKGYISHWLSATEGISPTEETTELVKRIEEKSKNAPEVACYWFGTSFARKKELTVCGKTVSNIPGLIRALFASPWNFYTSGAYEKLVSPKTGADVYGFLYAMGYQEQVELAAKAIGAADTFTRFVLVLGLLYGIARQENADTQLVRRFFLEYGPLGIYTCVKELAEDTANPVYTGLDSDGRRVLEQIIRFRIPNEREPDALLRACKPLMNAVTELRKMLVDNPFLISAGAYENHGVLCSDLCGCFRYRIFDTDAPLAFYGKLSATKGGRR